MPKNILLVEASDYHRRVYARFIKTLGYEVGTADNARSAIEIIDALRERGISVDAIITGMRMRGGSGLLLLQLLSERHSTIPCLVHSTEKIFSDEFVSIDDLTKIGGIFDFAQFRTTDERCGHIETFLDSIQK